MKTQDLEWENWFDIFIDHCRTIGYNGPVDSDTFRDDWQNGCSPEESAESFVKEMTED